MTDTTDLEAELRALYAAWPDLDSRMPRVQEAADALAAARTENERASAALTRIRLLVMNTDGDYLDGSDFDGLAGAIQMALKESGFLPDPLSGRWSNGDPTHIITDGLNRRVAPNLNGATWIPSA